MKSVLLFGNCKYDEHIAYTIYNMKICFPCEFCFLTEPLALKVLKQVLASDPSKPCDLDFGNTRESILQVRLGWNFVLQNGIL